MRSLALGAAILCGAACIPFEPYWWIQDPRVLGMRMTVVEPGGYSTLLHVPPGQQRATPLPLDTVELERFVATPEGVAVEPPIWLACFSPNCFDRFYAEGYYLADCPQPLPFYLPWACRLGEGERVRVGFDGAFTLPQSMDVNLSNVLTIMAIGSRSPDVSSETCLERYAGTPHEGLQDCLIARDVFVPGPLWAVLPFAPELAMLPPEFLEQAPDTHPDITGFRVSRERGATRIEALAMPGDTVAMAPGEKVTVLPLFLAGREQSFIVLIDPDADGPLPPVAEEQAEFVEINAQITALVDQFEKPDQSLSLYNFNAEISWVVPDHPEPATLYVQTRDSRAGRGFAVLHFDPS